MVAPDGATIWMPRMEVDKDNPEVGVPAHMPVTFNEADMDLLESGLIVFRTPKAILRAFNQIRQNPIL